MYYQKCIRIISGKFIVNKSRNYKSRNVECGSDWSRLWWISRYWNNNAKGDILYISDSTPTFARLPIGNVGDH